MVENIFFTIVIPTLNEEKFLPLLLSDLVNQKFQNFETIIVDGHSEDQTHKVYQKYKKLLPNLHFLYSSKRNLPYQRNLGVKKAKGKYLVFLDADVSIPQNYLQEIYFALLKQKVDFLTTWLEGDENNIKSNLMMNTTNILIEVCKLINKPFVCGGNAIISKTAFDKVKGYKEDLKILEDFDLSVRLNKKGYKLYVLKKPKLIVSLRRLRKEGAKKTLGKYALYTAYFFLKGAPTTDIFKYKMGGQIYEQKEELN